MSFVCMHVHAYTYEYVSMCTHFPMYPQYSQPEKPVFRPHVEHKHTEIKPFKFEERYQNKPTRDDYVRRKLEEEQRELAEVRVRRRLMPFCARLCVCSLRIDDFRNICTFTFENFVTCTTCMYILCTYMYLL